MRIIQINNLAIFLGIQEHSLVSSFYHKYRRHIIKNVEITFAISISFEFADKVTVGCAAVISEKMVIRQ